MSSEGTQEKTSVHGLPMKKNCEKQIKKSLELKKKSREKGINGKGYMLNGKITAILVKAGLIKKCCYIKWVIFQNHIPVAKTNRSWIRFCKLRNKIWLKKYSKCWYIEIC